MKKLLLTAVLSLVHLSAHAGLIYKTNYLSDTASGLDWLYLSETVNRSANDIYSNLQLGGDLYGWTLATFDEVTTLFDAAGGTGPYRNSSGHQGVYNALVASWGAGSDNNRGNAIWAHLADPPRHPSIQGSGLIIYASGYSRFSDAFALKSSEYTIGHALYRPTVVNNVPEPGSLLLLGLGLGIVGWQKVRRKIPV